MKAQEKKLILDLYKHYKINFPDIDGIDDKDLLSLYNKFGNIKEILRNLILEFEPNTIITEDYLDNKLRAYGISEVDVLNNSQNEILKSDNKVPKKGKNKFLLIVLIVSLVIGSSILILFNKNENVIDEVRIGDQIWMRKNLNVDKFRNGDPIPEAKTLEEWIKAGKNEQPAWCYYNNDSTYGKKYGKLYNWYAVNDIRGLAPEGWKIPSYNDWVQITEYLGGEYDASTKMKNVVGWSYEGNGTNESRFSGLPGGGLYSLESGGVRFINEGVLGLWWSSTDYNLEDSYFYYLHYDGTARSNNYNKKNGYSVRCLKDQINSEKNKTKIVFESDFSIEIPDFLNKSSNLHEEASLQYQNEIREYYIIVLEESINEFKSTMNIDPSFKSNYSPNLDGYTKFIRENMLNIIENKEESKVTQKIINGMPARIFEISGKIDGIDIYYVIACIQGKKNFYQIVNWTLQGSKKECFASMRQSISSFKEK